jgi:X-Pro dipeptidyl-peptidase
VVDRYRPCDQLDHTTHGYNPQPDYDAFWLDRDYRIRAQNITIPVLVGHGLDDFNVKTTGGLEMFRRVRGPKRLVIGQWTHASPGGTTIGTWENLLWRWFDQWLLGLDTQVTKDPAVDVEDTKGKWHQEASWPPATARLRTLWLAAGGSLVGTAGAPTEESLLDLPAMTEERMMSEGADPGRLLYVGAPESHETRIAGEPEVTLSMTSDSTSTHIAMLLADLAPDGTYERISRGFMNPRYRNGFERGEDLTPGEAYTVSFSLSPADHVVAAGHRIAVAVAGSNLVWAVPDLQRAQNTLHLGKASGSTITLPVVEPAAVRGTKTVTPPPKTGSTRAGLPATGVGRAPWAVGLVVVAIAFAAVLRRTRIACS